MPSVRPQSWFALLYVALKFAYIASRLLTEQRVSRVSELTDIIPDLSTQALISALGYEYNGDVDRINDALRLVDRVLVISPELHLYVLRAAAAAVLNDHAVFIESFSVSCRALDNSADVFC